MKDIPGFKFETCYRCKTPFYFTAAQYEACKASSAISFYCPYGHGQIYREGPSEADKLRQERDRLAQKIAEKEDEVRMALATANQQLEYRKAAERQASALKGVATRMKNRVSNGVCPCCNRTFADLQRHMASKHKGFKAEEISADGATIQ